VAVAKKDISSVLKSGLPATAYVEDFETKRVLESIKTALRLLGNILDGNDKSVALGAIPPDVQIDAGPNIQVARKGQNWFRISAMFAIPEGGDQTGGGGGGANFLFELGDVTLTSPTTGQVLKYNGSKWVNGAGVNDYSFQFTQTGNTGGTLSHGKVYVKGVPLTCSGWTNHASDANLTISSITVTTYFYWLIDLAAATAAWTSNTTGFPAVTATVYPYPILTLTCAGSVITTIKEHRDVHLPGNV
jgi:hypothetical protein